MGVSKRLGSGGTSVGTTLKKIANETISALKLVVAVNDERVEIAEPDNYNNSKVLGVAITGGNVNDEINIVTFGELKDSFFNFTLNEPLFLEANGTITETPPTTGFVVTIGHGLGSGAIFVNINEQIDNC